MIELSPMARQLGKHLELAKHLERSGVAPDTVKKTRDLL